MAGTNIWLLRLFPSLIVRFPAWSALRMCTGAMLDTRGLAPFGVSIHRVVPSGSQEKMVRSHTRRIVAVVAHRQAIRDRSIRQMPRDAVRVVAPPVPVQARANLPIPELVPARCPYPATFGLMDLRPEPIGKWARPFADACRPTEVSHALADVGGRRGEWRPARCAKSLHNDG
jgi:hypothetical protein